MIRFNIDDTPNIFKHNFPCSMFKSNNTNDNDDNNEIVSNIYITISNVNFDDFFIIFNVLVNIIFYNTNIGIIYNESNNKQITKQYVFCKIGILDSKAGTTQIVIIRQLDLNTLYFR